MLQSLVLLKKCLNETETTIIREDNLPMTPKRIEQKNMTECRPLFYSTVACVVPYGGREKFPRASP